MGLKKLDSEYKSNFKSIPVHRPVMVKAKSVSHPLDNAPEALESSRRAGLLSNQIGSVSEPPLQRRKIVPYQHNHNIFETRTVKELDDQQWIEAVGSDVESQRNTQKITKPEKVKTNKKDTEYSSHYLKSDDKTESPLIAAEKRSKTLKKHKTATKTQDISPDRLPPAGRPTYISDPRDKRLLRPSDSSAYLTFPDYGDIPKKTGTEYTERYEDTTPGNKNKSIHEIKPEQTSFIDAETYRKVIEQRNHAYGISPSKTHLLQKTPTPTPKKKSSAEKYSTRSPRISEDDMKSNRSSTSSRRSRKDERKTTKHDEKRVNKTQFLDEKREQNEEKGIVALKKSRRQKNKEEHQGVNRHRKEQTFSKRPNGKRAKSTHVSRTTDDRTPRHTLERGRSPTPELRQVGQSRRHHLDVTTGNNNPLASSVDQYKTHVLNKMADLDIRNQRPEYDPSCYSDVTSTISSWTGPSYIDSRSVSTSRSSKRSF